MFGNSEQLDFLILKPTKKMVNTKFLNAVESSTDIRKTDAFTTVNEVRTLSEADTAGIYTPPPRPKSDQSILDQSKAEPETELTDENKEVDIKFVENLVQTENQTNYKPYFIGFIAGAILFFLAKKLKFI